LNTTKFSNWKTSSKVPVMIIWYNKKFSVNNVPRSHYRCSPVIPISPRVPGRAWHRDSDNLETILPSLMPAFATFPATLPKMPVLLPINHTIRRVQLSQIHTWALSHHTWALMQWSHQQ
jgi:hypothetical protein